MMLEHYEENFAEMTPQEKENFLGRFSCLSLESDYINDLFALMVYTKYLNTLGETEPGEVPQVLQIARSLLWDAMASGETVVTDEMIEFQECCQAAACMLVNSDDSYMDTEEKEDFYHKYFDDWDYDDTFMDMFGHLLYDIVNQNGESPDRVGELMENLVESWVAEFLGWDENAPLTGSQWDKRRADVHASPIFCDIIARLQEDMREAMSGKPAGELRERYQTLGLFSEEELKRFRA